MKKDTHGVFICIIPNWNFPLKNTVPIPFAARRKPPYLCGTTQNRRKKPNKSLPYFLELELQFSEISFGAMSWKGDRRNRVQQLWMYELQPQISPKHHKTPRNWNRAISTGENGSTRGRRSLSCSQSSVVPGVLCKSCQKGRAERKGSAPQRNSESKLSRRTAEQEARGDAGRREQMKELKIWGRVACPCPQTVCWQSWNSSATGMINPALPHHSLSPRHTVQQDFNLSTGQSPFLNLLLQCRLWSIPLRHWPEHPFYILHSSDLQLQPHSVSRCHSPGEGGSSSPPAFWGQQKSMLECIGFIICT